MLNQSEFIAARKAHLESVQTLLRAKREEAQKERRKFFQPCGTSEADYEKSLPAYRTTLKNMLGWPLTEPSFVPKATITPLSENAEGRAYRVSFEMYGQTQCYGLLFLPPNAGRYPLVITQHGGLGSPELAAGLMDGSSANYNQLIRGLRSENIAVFAPQLLVWDKGQEPSFDQNLLDREFRHLGGSRAAFDLQVLQSSLNWLVTHPEINESRIGMAGLSYGGFYTLFLSALDPRIRVAVCSCFINDRFRYNWEDWVWTGSANRFLDSEVARMVCPRPLFMEAGEKDEVFEVSGFSAVAQEVAQTYRALGIADRFHSRIHPGGHEYDPDGKAREFLLKWL